MAAYEIFKWLKSENCSSKESKRLANKTRKAFGLTHKKYRKMLSYGREKVNVLERLMSDGRFDEIEFDKIPSKAGLIYKNAFARRDIIAKKYETFAKSENTKVNADTLYPYDVVRKATSCFDNWHGVYEIDEIDKAIIEKYWNNLPDYFNGNKSNIMCVVDTSGSMTWREGNGVTPMDVAISLGMYCAEKNQGPFHNHFISFSSRPQFIKIEGVDFVDKVKRIYRQNLCSNTDIAATFDLLLKTALAPDVKTEDLPETIIIISDMQIDSMSTGHWNADTTRTEMERIRQKWEQYGVKMPRLVYWNVNASKNTILDAGPDVSFVSGCSPVIFEQVITGKTGYDLMLAKLNSERYAAIQ